MIPMIWTGDLNQTVTFYVERLGFTCGEKNEEWGWASLHRDQCEVMVARPNAHAQFEKPVFTGSFYVRTDAVENLWEEVKDTVDVCYELETFDWGMKEFAIFDNNGYVIQFGQEMEP